MFKRVHTPDILLLVVLRVPGAASQASVAAMPDHEGSDNASGARGASTLTCASCTAALGAGEEHRPGGLERFE